MSRITSGVMRPRSSATRRRSGTASRNAEKSALPGPGIHTPFWAVGSVLLARALCAAGRILFLDEPVTGLDPEATGEMYSLIDRINKECMTIVMISHDISLAVKYANKILHIGKKIFFGKKEDYINSEIGINFLKREGM